MALGKAKKGADASKKPDTKTTKVPDNAPLLVDRLKPLQMQKLLLDKMADGTPVTIDDVLHLIQKAETNKDIAAGKVADETEVESTHKSAALERMSTTTKIELEADFAQFDKNGDGSITLDEFIAIMHRPVAGHEMPQFEDAELVMLFQQMDVDGGGTVCYQEFADQWAIDREEEAIMSAEEEATAA